MLCPRLARGAAVSALEPYAVHAVACFGPDKLLWGSDWPVLEQAGAYAAWHQAARALVAPQERSAVFDRVARQIYRV